MIPLLIIFGLIVIALLVAIFIGVKVLNDNVFEILTFLRQRE